MTTWTLPPTYMLPPAREASAPVGELARTLRIVLRDLETPADIVKVHEGPATIGFELQPREGIRMRDFTRLGRSDDIAYALQSESVRIQAPIPGRNVVGIEIPSPCRRTVALSEVAPYARAPLHVGLGIAPDGHPVKVDISVLPHLAVAGASGSGKSSLLHTIVCSLLTACTPDDLRLVLVDVKRVEFRSYRGLPHLGALVNEPGEAVEALELLVEEVEERYRLLDRNGARNIGEYNRTAPEGRLSTCLCVVDELADLMMRSRHRVEESVTRLGQLGRACGVHLVLATQSPHREILSGLIKANTPARIALRVASGVHSRVAIDQTGAERLLGQGDALLQDGQSVCLQRFQSAYVPQETISALVQHWAAQVPRDDVAAPALTASPKVRFTPVPEPARTFGVLQATR